MTQMEVDVSPPTTPAVSRRGGLSLLHRRETAFAALALGLAAAPFIAQTTYQMYMINLVILAAIGALALNLLTGIAGQVAMGNAVFLGIGAFTVVIVTRAVDVPFFVAVPAAVIVSGLIGLVAGIPALRLKGLYLLLSTLALHYIFFYVATEYQTSEVGSGGFQIAAPSLFGWTPSNQLDWYMLIAPSGLLCMFLAANLVHTRAGRNWVAIMYNETVAAGLGVPTREYKVLAFVISSMMIGFQGAMTAYFLGFVSSDVWGLNVAIAYVAMIILGGLGSLTGSVIGAAIVTLLPTWIANFLATTDALPGVLTSNPGPVTTFIYGALIVTVLLLAPAGVMGLIKQAWARIAGSRR